MADRPPGDRLSGRRKAGGPASLGRRAAFVAGLGAIVSVLLLAAVWGLNERRVGRAALLQEAVAVGDWLGSRLADTQPLSIPAEELAPVLEVLRVRGTILGIGIYGADGRQLAATVPAHSTGQVVLPQRLSVPARAARLQRKQLTELSVQRALTGLGGEHLGWLVVMADGGALQRAGRSQLRLAGIAVLASGVFTAALTLLLWRSISGSLNALAREARDIGQAIGQTAEADLSLPAAAFAELVPVVDACNAVLEHARQLALEQRAQVLECQRAAEDLRRCLAERQARLDACLGEHQALRQELEAFTYSVSHDLRAPLRGIDGFALAVIEDYGERLEAAAHEHLQRVRKAAQRMGEMLDALLNFARVGHQDMDRQTVDLSALARGIVAELRAAQPGRPVAVDIEDGLCVSGDQRLLYMLLHNLLDNAWKFTRHRPQAQIRFYAETHNGRREFVVEDNGAGFDMAHAGKLFEPFRRLHTESEFPGTGLGLCIVQRIIERHGGRIRAEGRPGRGARFGFNLP